MKWLKSLMCSMCLIVMSATIVMAQDEQLSFEVTADYNGKYIWRGQNLDDDPVFQPGLSAGYGSFTIGIWGSLETTDYNCNSGEFTEVDYYFDYSAEIPNVEGLGFSVGAVYYDFPGTSVPGTTELYWGFSYDCPLSPSITFNHDIDEAEGVYISAGIGHSIDLGEDAPVGIDLGASYGWADSSYNEYYWGIDDSAANDLTLSAAFPFEIGGWTVNPSVNYVALISSDVKETNAYGTDDDLFYVGIGFSKGF